PGSTIGERGDDHDIGALWVMGNTQHTPAQLGDAAIAARNTRPVGAGCVQSGAATVCAIHSSARPYSTIRSGAWVRRISAISRPPSGRARVGCSTFCLGDPLPVRQRLPAPAEGSDGREGL